jgi:hypothetical protein
MGTPCKMIITINPTQRLTPTGRKGYYSITRARTSINRLSLALTVEFCTRRSSNNCPRYPRGRILVVKHRQSTMSSPLSDVVPHLCLLIKIQTLLTPPHTQVCYHIRPTTLCFDHLLQSPGFLLYQFLYLSSF